MRLDKPLVLTLLTYGAEAWTMKIRDGLNITLIQMWRWRRARHVSWMEKITDHRILQIGTRLELVAHIRNCKVSYFGKQKSRLPELTKTVVEERSR